MQHWVDSYSMGVTPYLCLNSNDTPTALHRQIRFSKSVFCIRNGGSSHEALIFATPPHYHNVQVADNTHLAGHLTIFCQGMLASLGHMTPAIEFACHGNCHSLHSSGARNCISKAICVAVMHANTDASQTTSSK